MIAARRPTEQYVIYFTSYQDGTEFLPNLIRSWARSWALWRPSRNSPMLRMRIILWGTQACTALSAWSTDRQPVLVFRRA